ncbi:L-dopachrome tautomerase yellow-f2-like [Bradysia coprophila]|uniref:L-dopachrome tautomerase yellow-f2-like n=1 Tax=Bradysia coprophila TaxID=38358 RepID=UPI00187DB253|nr:L-dopachrome tautomerase yellow-f2-like [Bradysia coprophila]
MWSEFLVIYCVFQNVMSIHSEFDEIFAWKQINYSNLPADKLSNPDYYVAKNNIPFGMARHGDWLYVGFPRRRTGVPSTLNRIQISSASIDRSPPFEAYPNYDLNDIVSTDRSNDKRIVSVYRPAVDACGRLWVVDTGVLEYPTGRVIVQPASIWIFNLTTNDLIRRFEIPQSMIPSGNGMTSITVDVETCDKTFAYINDLFSYSLVVYSFESNSAWRFLHNFFHLDPLYGTFDISNIKFMWRDGIFSIALGARLSNGYRMAYFHSSTSLNEFSVSTQVIRNQSLSTRIYHNDDFKLYGQYEKGFQSNIHVIDDRTGVAFLNLFQQYGVGCFNINRHSSRTIRTNVVQCNRNEMVYPSHLNIDGTRNLWLLTNNVPRFFYSSLNDTEYNFRIWRIAVDDAICIGNCLQV